MNFLLGLKPLRLIGFNTKSSTYNSTLDANPFKPLLEMESESVITDDLAPYAPGPGISSS
jgi:hypothetical protein